MGEDNSMIKLKLDNGKSVMEFTIDSTSLIIKDLISGEEFKADKKVFGDQGKSNRARTELRRKKGEKFYNLWIGDLKKYCSFETEEEIEEDITKDFIRNKGWRLVSRQQN